MKKTLATSGLLLVSIIWGFGFVATDIALETLTTFQILTIRFIIGGIITTIIAFKSLPQLNKNIVKAGILLGIALFIGFVLQTIGIQHTTPSKNAFITTLNVVIVPFIAFFMSNHKLKKLSIVGACMSVVGVAVLSLNADLSFNKGDLFTLLCAVAFAFQIYFISQFSREYNPILINFIQMMTALVLSAAALLITNQQKMTFTPRSLGGILYLGIFSTGVAYFLQSVSQKHLEGPQAAIILSTEAVFGSVLSVLMLGEEITTRMIIGSAIILAAVTVANLGGSESSVRAVS